MSVIHSTAIVSPNAVIADDVRIEAYAIIEDDVVIGPGCSIGSCSRIQSGTRLGENVSIGHGAALGSRPQDLKFKNEKSYIYIGDGTDIREFCVLSRGTGENGETRVGKNCFLMAYAHVAHDCLLGDNIILANAVNMAGHVMIEDFAIVGGVVPIHQFVRIGCHSMIGGGFRVPKDVPPYILAGSEPLIFCGLNSVGLRRRGFSTETRRALQQAYRILYRSGLNVLQALEKMEEECSPTPELEHAIAFIRGSERGIIAGARRTRSERMEADEL
jgi:UDP-N-acetylglucosamine acyltransferase